MKLIIAAATILAMTVSAHAQTVTHYNNLTPHQVQNLLGGYHLQNNGALVKKTQGVDPRDLPDTVRIDDLPDILTPTEVVDRPAVHNPRGEAHQEQAPRNYGALPADGKGRWWNEECQTNAYVNNNVDCVAQTMMPGSSATPGTTKVIAVASDGGTVEVPVDGGTELVTICTRDKAELDFDWHGFDVTITSNTQDGAC